MVHFEHIFVCLDFLLELQYKVYLENMDSKVQNKR